MTRIPSPRFVRTALLTSSAIVASLALTPAVAFAQQSQTIQIEAQSLDTALVEVGRRYGVSVVSSGDLTRGKRGRAVSGELTATQALGRVLAGTGLVAERSGNGYVIRRAPQARTQIKTASVQAASSATPEEIESDPIVVTGSRIERAAADSPAPIDIVTSEEIERLGLADNTEALRFIPALQQSLTLTTVSNLAGGGRNTTGIATLNLRGLGPERTLTLVNGRRHVAGAQGTAAVDVATIPRALVDRIEVLTGGGSSIYGADAVSGVVNYVLKDDFEGIEYDAGYNLTTRNGGGDAYFGSVTIGTNFSESRGNAVVSVEYNRQGNVQAADRFGVIDSYIFGNSPEIASAFGVDPQFANTLVPDLRVSIIPREEGLGLSFIGNNTTAAIQQFDGGTVGGFPAYQFFDVQTGELRAFDLGVPVSAILNSGGDGLPFFAATNASDVIPQIERVNVNALASYEIVPEVTAFVEAKYARTDAFRTTTATYNQRNVPITLENPFIPDNVQAQIDSLIAQGITPELAISQQLDGPNDISTLENDRETFRVVGGFRGEPSEAFNYDVSLTYGRTETSLRRTGEILFDRFFAGVDAVVDPNTGNTVCRSDLDPSALPPIGAAFPTARQPGFTTFVPGDGTCTPINLFAPITQEAANFFTTTITETFAIDQFVANATFTGKTTEFFELPGGPIGYAAGVEYREESSINRPDALALAGLNAEAFFEVQEVVAGEFDVFEGFAEVSLPLLSNVPFAELLQIDASVRAADYSTAGTATSYAFGGVWQPVDDFRIRASYNRSVRAPNITELFTPQIVQADNAVDDPCSPANVGANANRTANCALLVPAGFDPDIFTRFDNPVIVTSGGNPNLDEETADTYTIGFAWTPSFAPGLSFVADYYNIDIENAIATGFVGDDLIFNCADAPDLDNAACDAVVRDPMSGLVTAVEATALNLAALSAEGIDYELAYAFNLNDVVGGNTGQFTFGVSGTWLLERENQTFAAIPLSTDDLFGEITDIGGFPRHFLNASLSWTKDRFFVDYGFNYQSSQFLATAAVGREQAAEDPFIVNGAETGDSFVHYLGAAYDFDDRFRLSVRVNNLFDRDPFPQGRTTNQIRPTSLLGRTVQFGIQGNF